MIRDNGKRGLLHSNLQDLLFLSSVEITFDNHSNYFKVSMPDGLEFNVTIDRLLDIF